VKRKAPKKPVLRYNGKNINKTDELIRFVGHFRKVYQRLFESLS